MDTIEPVEPDAARRLNDHPEFELEYYFDDRETTITICSADTSGKLATEWITIDASHAVAFEHIR